MRSTRRSGRSSGTRKILLISGFLCVDSLLPLSSRKARIAFLPKISSPSRSSSLRISSFLGGQSTMDVYQVRPYHQCVSVNIRTMLFDVVFFGLPLVLAVCLGAHAVREKSAEFWRPCFSFVAYCSFYLLAAAKCCSISFAASSWVAPGPALVVFQDSSSLRVSRARDC